MIYDAAGIDDSIKNQGHWPESPDTPTLTLFLQNLENRSLRRVKQLGVTGVSMAGLDTGGLETWTDHNLKRHIERAASADLQLRNVMFNPSPRVRFGEPGRDEDIETINRAIQIAGRQGLPVMEYNFYAHRIVEGYRVVAGRGGSGLMDFNYERVKNLPPLVGESEHSLSDMWDNVTYFLKAVIPVAAEANVRLALHPNDPPAPLSRGSGQIMSTLDGWKKLTDIVPSPYNGITFDCGVTKELGHDPVEVCRYFGERDQINHVHFRNVVSRVPNLDYTEVWIDEGQVDMFAVMSELVRQKYPRLIYPEHPPANDADTEFPFDGISATTYTGFAYTVGYARAMMQAAISTQAQDLK
ncbi:MAG: mannonate dehydratase [Chloroflexota bacterium]|nr:mannonate dehydratase [Chloroflexota bacterium]MQG37106.1 TIM barrel protein [SAR202 cluster bacterium]|tara:strand:+ start:43065 stop:44129 length:1065 start_codon:yes stop_codon:yes gene_type:complete